MPSIETTVRTCGATDCTKNIDNVCQLLVIALDETAGCLEYDPHIEEDEDVSEQ